MGKNKQESAQIMQYVFMVDSEFGPLNAAWLYPILGYSANDEAGVEKAKENFGRVMKALDIKLSNKTWLVGNDVTLADICLTCVLVNFYKLVCDPGYSKQFPSVTRWFNHCINQNEFKQVIGNFEFCKKMRVYGDNKN